MHPPPRAFRLQVKRTLLAGLREKVTYQPATAEDGAAPSAPPASIAAAGDGLV
jgi:hypothetical protein